MGIQPIVEAAPPDPLAVFEGVAQELGEEEATAEIRTLRERLEGGRFFVACVGQFKRGKSTLLNALVGFSLLPVGVVPVTAVVTVLRYGSELRVRIRTDAWRDVPVEELASYVTEQQNPANAKGVTGVEVYVPSALLAGGMCLVDTPGLGSVFASNTDATRAFVPHIDAALVVLGADPPISGEELAFIGEATANVDAALLVINKADRVSPGDLMQARSFTESTVSRRLGRSTCEVLLISATERLAGSKSRDWPLLEKRLDAWAHERSTQFLEQARQRGLARLQRSLARSLDAHRSALVRPIDESMERLEALTAAVEAAERALLELEPLLRAEEAVLARALATRQAVFLESARGTAAASLLERLAAKPQPRRLLRRAFEIAQDVAREHVERWALDLRPEAEELYRRATARFVVLGNDFLRRVRATGGDVFADLPPELDPAPGLLARSHFYFTELLTLAAPNPASAIFLSLLSPPQALRAAHRRAVPYLVRLLETNSARMINDLAQQARDSGVQLRAQIAGVLRALVASARRAIERARSAQAVGESEIQAVLMRLEVLRTVLCSAELTARHDSVGGGPDRADAPRGAGS